MVIGFVAFLYRELTHDKPLVRLKVFKNRNFAVGCLLIFLFGGVI
jgi:DHA2 family multidrug resistance protein